MEAVIRKWQQKFRKGKEEMEKWEALQVRWVSLFRNASSIIQRLQVTGITVFVVRNFQKCICDFLGLRAGNSKSWELWSSEMREGD